MLPAKTAPIILAEKQGRARSNCILPEIAGPVSGFYAPTLDQDIMQFGRFNR